ncbi:MAG: PQQ-binding-like beta-propeller repeat protein [Phycisphaera sp.]|nr:PQQ-binding-like beta-propeller repeat protein [Phycisphaera sp.]
MRLTAVIIAAALLISPVTLRAADPPAEPAAVDASAVPDLRTRTDGSDWPRYLGPTVDAKSAEKGINTKWGDLGPPIRWQRAIGEGYASPTISRGRLFLFDRVKDENRLTCMNAETGEDLWEFKYPTDFEDMLGYSGGPRCSPLVEDDRVYVIGGEGMLHCLDVVTGKVKWKMDTLAKFHVVKNFFGVGSTPIIEGDLLIMQVGGSPNDEAATDVYAAQGNIKNNGSDIVALNKLTGEVVYKTGEDLASYSSPVLATIDGRRWCFVFARSGLIGFDPANGKVDFQFPYRARKLESVNASNPVVVGSEILLSECYELGAVKVRVQPGACETVWSDKDKRGREKSMMAHFNTPIYQDGYVYGSSGYHSGEAEYRCLDWKTGKVMWSVPKLGRCTQLMIDGHLIILSEFGGLMLVRVNPAQPDAVAAVTLKDANGKELIKYPAWAAPIVSHGLLYVKGADRLVCMELIPPKQ